MAIYGNLNARQIGLKGVFEASLLKSTISGHIFDVLAVDNFTDKTPIPMENGVCLTLGDYTNNKKGLQERYGKIAGVKDKVVVTGSVVNIKDARFALEETEPYFEVPAGEDSKCYEVEGNYTTGDVYGVGLHQFTTATQELAKVRGNYVVLDGTGKYVAMATKPNMANYGFVGLIHSTWTNNVYTLVRIHVLQNEDKNTN